MDLRQHLYEAAVASGCAGFGVTSADALVGIADTMADRKAAGLSGKLHFTYKDPETAADVRASFPWAQSVVVVSWSYLPESGSPGPPEPGTGKIARFATADHYAGLRGALEAVSNVLSDQGWQTATLADDDRLVDRAVAVRAGVAWWGKSSMVLDPRHGPWLLLGSVVTDAPLQADQPMARDCGSCDACIPACPTGAIVAPGVLDASKCLAHWMQVPGTIPIALREPMSDRIYGCDDCLDACPPGSKRLSGVEVGVGRVDLLDLLAADDRSLVESFAHFYLPRRRPRVLRRNAIVALANSIAEHDGGSGTPGRTEAVSVLAGFLGDPDDTFRVHAAWGLGRIGGRDAVALLRFQLARERTQEVVDEIGAAIAIAEVIDR